MVRQYFFGSSQITDRKVRSPIIWEREYEGKKYHDKGVVLGFVPNDTLSLSYLSNWTGLPDHAENYLFVKYEVTQAEGGPNSPLHSQTMKKRRLSILLRTGPW